MSYILDALRKAESARETEGLATLLASRTDKPEPPAALAASAPPRPRWLPALAAGLGLGLALVLGVWLLQPAATPPGPTVPPEVAAPVPVPVPAPPPAPTHAAAPAPLEARPQLPPQSPPQTPPQLPPPLSSTQPPAQAATQAPRTEVPSPSPERAEPGRTRPSAQAQGQAQPQVDVALPPIDMPEDIRRSLPPLAVGGAMHSDNPASRMLVINGRVFHEGDTLSPGLVLDQIQLKSAVLRYQGQRYWLRY